MNSAAAFRPTAATTASLFALACASVLATGCGGAAELDYGETLVHIDTNLRVPNLIDRLRIDVFNQRGEWIDSRDVAVPDANAWPASFGLIQRESSDAHAVVRVRAYPAAVVRDVAPTKGPALPGETPYTTVAVPDDIWRACEDAPTLTPGEAVNVRRGPWPITTSPSCSLASGAAAITLVVPVGGRHRFEVVQKWPHIASARRLDLPLTLVLRQSCTDAQSEITCASGPTLEADLAPGTYTLLVSGPTPGELVEARVFAIGPGTASTPPALPEPNEVTPETFHWYGDSPEPTTEPIPAASLERVLWVPIAAKKRGRVQVLLDGGCSGRSSLLSVANGTLVPEQTYTCVDDSNPEVILEPLELETRSADASVSAVGTYYEPEPCPASDDPTRVCVPGGMFLFGGSDYRGYGVASSVPERIAAVSTFWLDRHEVSVAAFREALREGLVNPDPRSPAAHRSSDDALGARHCTWALEPDAHEDFGLSCVSWHTARAYCQFRGGDLPTEVQWEYAASAAGKDRETHWPWADDHVPSCGDAVYGRTHDRQGRDCIDYSNSKAGPVSITAQQGTADATPQGVVGMAGGLVEWVLDSAHSLDHECWARAPLLDPSCDEPAALLRGQRGGNWGGPREGTRALTRSRQPPNDTRPTVGFRCAYTLMP